MSLPDNDLLFLYSHAHLSLLVVPLYTILYHDRLRHSTLSAISLMCLGIVLLVYSRSLLINWIDYITNTVL